MSIYKSNQEIINKIYKHFIMDKNPRCINQCGSCCYSGTGCAIGCLLEREDSILWDNYGDIFTIPKNLYEKYFEESSINLLS